MVFNCNITEDLVDRINAGSSLAIEVWGHRDRYTKLESGEKLADEHELRFRSSSLLSEKRKSLTERCVDSDTV